MSLFRLGDFTLHSGDKSYWKIDCDALTASDWEALAYMIHEQLRFDSVIGIPRGGEKLAKALAYYREPGYPILIVDDVLTTGKSMEALKEVNESAIGAVVFARGECPTWVTALFHYTQAGDKTTSQDKHGR